MSLSNPSSAESSHTHATLLDDDPTLVDLSPPTLAHPAHPALINPTTADQDEEEEEEEDDWPISCSLLAAFRSADLDSAQPLPLAPPPAAHPQASIQEEDDWPISSSFVAAVSKLDDNYGLIPPAFPSHASTTKNPIPAFVPPFISRAGKENVDPRHTITPKRFHPAPLGVPSRPARPALHPPSTSRLPNPNPNKTNPNKRKCAEASPVPPAKRHKSETESELAAVIYDTFQFRPKPDTSKPHTKGPKTADTKIEPTIDQPPPSYHIIAHDSTVQQQLDNAQIAFGVQWELARLLTLGRYTWSDLTPSHILSFRGPHAHAGPLVSETLWNLRPSSAQKPESVAESTVRQWGTSAHPAFTEERSIKAPWAELDREQEALLQPGYRGLGCSDRSSSSNTYHGKVLFCATVHWTSPSTPQIRLDKPEIGPSTRFARRFSSRRFLRLKEVFPPRPHPRPSDLTRLQFFCRKFVLMGRVYRAFYEKEGTVHLVETEEDYGGRVGREGEGDALRMGWGEFVGWHNPMELNQNQIMTKWKSRFALGLSTSIPGVKIKPEHVFFIRDIISSLWDGKGKPPAHFLLADGCGLINSAGMKVIADRLGWEKTPSTSQGRFGPAKGMFCLHPDNDDDEPMIWLRDSQVKINYGPPSDWDPALLIFDVVKPPHLSSPAKLSVETIVALSHAGVPHQVFFHYLNEGLSEFTKDLTDWHGERAALRHWNAISRAGRVIGGRVRRAAAGAARAKGLGVEREEENEVVDEDVQDATDERSTAWWGDQISGCPSSIEESAMCVLNSGFTLKNCEYARRKVKQSMKTTIAAYVSRYRLHVPKSAEGFIIPDPVGVLKKGQVYMHMSQPVIDERSGEEINVIVGPVVVVRHPCKLPSDAQLVSAVDCPELRRYKDVIVFSVDETDRSLASKLGGGDYDGDIASLYWDPQIVNHFKNASDRFLDAPSCIDDFFERSTVQVSEFLREHPQPTEHSMQLVQECLLASVGQPPAVGIWSMYHDLALYKWGLDSDKAVLLAYMFTTCLDGSKSGLRVKADVQRAFDTIMKTFQPPNWKLTPEDESRNWLRGCNVNGNYNSKFIMERLKHEGKRVGDHHLGKFDEAWNSVVCEGIDTDLVAPLENMAKFAIKNKALKSDILRELDAIAEHVQEVRKRHRASFSKGSSRADQDDKHGFTAQDITVRQDILRALSCQFAEGPPPDRVPILHQLDPSLVERLKASFAYKHDWEVDDKEPDGSPKPDSKRGTSFPFDVALRILCEIKAHASGRTMTVMQEFYEGFTLHKGYVKMHS